MANMYPDILPAAVTSDMARNAEVKVFNALKQDLPDDCDVYYSVSWHSKKSATNDGEADFVIMDRRRGLMVLEVKGGKRIWRENSKWFTETHGGKIYPIKNPLAQAVKNKQTMKSKQEKTKILILCFKI